MKNITKIIKYIIPILILSAFFSVKVSQADLTPNFWAQTANNVLMTNTPGGFATADIHVAHCYIGTGTGTSCGGGGSGGTVTSITGFDSVATSPGTITTTGTVGLVNDTATPGASQYYGTNSSGVRGWFPSSGGGTIGGSIAATQIAYGFGTNTIIGDTDSTRSLSNEDTNILTPFVTITPAVFSGSGLNDLTAVGGFTGTTGTVYTVTIASTGTPDTFDWTNSAGGSGSGISITGTFQSLNQGVELNFRDTTGHTLGDSWTITAITQKSGFQTNGSIFGFPLGGAGLTTNASNGVTGVFTGSGEGENNGASNLITDIHSSDTVSGESSNIAVETHQGIDISTSDAAGDSADLSFKSNGSNGDGIQSQFQDSTGVGGESNVNASKANLQYNGATDSYDISAQNDGVHLHHDGSTYAKLPITDGTAGQVLTTNGTTQWSWENPPSGVCGSNTQVQFNDMGSCGADPDFLFQRGTNPTFQVGDLTQAGNQTTINLSDSNNEIDFGGERAVHVSGPVFTGTGLNDFGVNNSPIGNLGDSYTVTVETTNTRMFAVSLSTSISPGDIITDTNTGATGTAQLYDGSNGHLLIDSSTIVGTFNQGDSYTTSGGASGLLNTDLGVSDTFTWAGPTITLFYQQMSNPPTFPVNNIQITFGNPLGHTDGDSWTWSYGYQYGRMAMFDGSGDISLGDVDQVGNRTQLLVQDQSQFIGAKTQAFAISDPSTSLGYFDAQYNNGNPDIVIGPQGGGNDTTFEVDDGNQGMTAKFNGTTTFQDTSGNEFFEVDNQDKEFQLGDINNTGSGTKEIIDDGAENITEHLAGSFFVTDTSGNPIFSASPNGGNPDIEMGDISNLSGGPTFIMATSTGNAILSANSGFVVQQNASGNQWLDVNPQGDDVSLGDLSNINNSTKFDIDDSNSEMIFQAARGLNAIDNGGNNWLTFNPNSGIFKYGLFNSGNYTNLAMSDSAESLTFHTGGNPSTGNVMQLIGGVTTTEADFGDIDHIGNDTTFEVDDGVNQSIIAELIGHFSVENTANHRVLDTSFGGDYSFSAGDVDNSHNGTTMSVTDSTQAIKFTYGGIGSYTFPIGNAAGVLTNDGSGNLSWDDIDWTDITGTPTTLAGYGITDGQTSATSGDLLAQTTAAASVATATSPNDGVKHTYSLGAYLNIVSVTLDVVQEQVTYTDENGTSQTETFFPPGLTSANIGSVGNFPMGTMNIRVNPNTVITIKTTLVTGTGSISYDVGGTIQLLK